MVHHGMQAELSSPLVCRWESTPYGFTLHVHRVEEIGPARAMLPLREAEVRAATGKSLEKELYGTMDFESRTATMAIGERRERRLVFHAPGL